MKIFTINQAEVTRRKHIRNSILFWCLLIIACPFSKTMAQEWIQSGPDVAKVYDYLISSSDSSIHLAAIGNGLQYSSNSGETWVPISLLDGLEVTAVAEIQTSQTIYFCGTSSGELFQSTDAAVWDEFSSSGLPESPIKEIILFNESPLQLIIVCYGIFRQTVSGEWEQIHDYLGIEDLIIEPDNPQIMYAAANYNVGVYKTDNGGADWFRVNNGLSNRYVKELVFDPLDSSKLFAATEGGIFYSANSAESWNAINTGLSELNTNTLAVDTPDSQNIYVGTVGGGVFKSSNGGSWRESNTNLENKFIQVIAIDPQQTNHIRCGSYCGLFRSHNAGQNWQEVDLDKQNAYVITLDVTPSQIYYAGLSGGELFTGDDSCTTWDRLPFPYSELNISAFAFSPFNEQILYVGTEQIFSGRLYISTDAGQNWALKTSGLPGNAIYEILPSPTNPMEIYLGNGLGLYKSIDGGETWNEAHVDLPDRTVQTILIDPEENNTIFAAFFNEGIYRSTDSGVSWSHKSEGLTNLQITTLAISPSSSANPMLYAGSWGGGVFRSANNGDLWEQCDLGINDLEVFDVKISTEFPNCIYVSTWHKGLLKSNDYGLSWIAMNNGLDNHYVRTILLDREENSIILAGTYGDSVKLYYDTIHDVPTLSFYGMFALCLFFTFSRRYGVD